MLVFIGGKLFCFFSVKMKCLLCSSVFELEKDLLNHYLSFHNIEKSNWFFQKLFPVKNLPFLKKCLRCIEFIVDSKSKTEHDFLMHYKDEKEKPFEDKPLDILKLPNLIIYLIDYHKHKDFSNFFDSNQCLDDFLMNVKDKFQNSNKHKKTIKC